MRTLLFNLKDAHNTDLRAHVLRGDITPDAFVRMTATELASKELADYRKKKEEEALKMAVLDAEAAAKFSTAAALDARDKLALPPAVVTGKLLAAKEDDLTIKDDDDDRQEPEMPVAGTPTAGKWSQEGSAGSPRSAPRSTQTQPKKEEEPESGKAASTAAAAVPIDWASIKAAAVHATSLSQEIPDIEGGMLRVPEGEDDDKGEGVRERESASPPPARSEASPSVDEALRKVFLPCPDPTAISTAVWESEIVVPGVGTYHLTADALMGCGDLATLMGNNPLQVRGRLALGKLDAFLSELHMSKHRTATLGLLRVAPGASEEEKTALGSLVEQYCSRDRTGVAESSPGIEVYLVPPGPLATRLLAVAREAEPVAVEASLPGGGTDLPSDRLLAVAIHKKELQAVPGLHRPVKRPRGGSGHGAATAAAATPQLPPVPAMGTLPQGSGASALPAGLDLSAISALAAAFGVAAGPDAAAEAQPQPEQKKERKSRWDDAIPGAPAPVSSSAPSQGMPPYGVGVPPMVPSAPAPTGPRPMASMAMQPPMQAPMQAPMQPYAPPGTAPGPGPYGPGPHQGPYPGSNGPPGADPMAHPPQGHGYPGGYPDHPGSIPMGSGYPGGPPQQHGYPQYHEQGPPGGYGQGFPSYRGGRGQMRGRGRGRGPPRGRFGS